MITIKPIVDSAALPEHVRVAAEINYGWWQKEKLWFDAPKTHAGVGNAPGNCWLMALLPLAFEGGERLRIHAPVDPTLLENTEKIQRIWAGWFPKRKPVRVQTEQWTQPAKNDGKIGLFFTGGVDSFFSLLHFDRMAGGGQKVDDLIYVRGFDIPLENRAAFERKTAVLSKIAASLGKNMIPMATNLRKTRLGKLRWGLRMHGPALGAAGLTLEKKFKVILISSSHGCADVTPWGTHPDSDPLMSSGQTRFIHYGSQIERFDKTAFIAKSDVALKHLHVCWQEGSDRNCGLCEKCYRTLLTLELLGVREKAANFPGGNISLEYLKSLQVSSPVARQYLDELKKPAIEHSRQDIADAIDACLAGKAMTSK
jgi:hypothetical protein